MNNTNFAGGGRRRRRNRPLTELNMTPFMDLMTVLLIIFMAAAPMMAAGINVDLPTAAGNDLSTQEEPLTVTVSKDGRLYLQETEVKAADVVEKLKALTEGKTDMPVYVRGDQGIQYGKMIEVMGLLAQAGFVKIGLVAELPR
jgi:biopolymer transport protein TolR